MDEEQVIKQLNKVYFEDEYWNVEKSSEEDITNYHKTMLRNGAIRYTAEEGILLGYIEVWRLSFEQLGRYICTRKIFALQEDVFTGEVAFLANCWIKPEFRGTWVVKDLKLKFLKNYSICKYYFGDRQKRPNSPFQIFKRG